MSERFRHVPSATAREIAAQKGIKKRTAIKNFIAYWANPNSSSSVVETRIVKSGGIAQRVEDQLRARIDTGEFSNGRLPSIVQLGMDLGASRITVRKAIEHLRAEGILEVRQGLGTFIAGKVTRRKPI